jgi:undecaprenyl diphosphate synthase
MQSALECRPKLHVAIIMDGNGRWATARGLARSAGHRAGVETVRRVCEAAPDLGITTLTLFAFSADNWRRPPAEVGALMGLLRHYLRTEVAKLIDNGTRLSIIGRRDRLPGDLAEDLADAEAATAAGGALHLRIALDYSSRDAILQAASAIAGNGGLSREAFGRLLSGRDASGDVDLLIRTGGEQRLSDFLLWECAYAELYFTACMWPDFDGDDLASALSDFHGRERRFGSVGVAEANAGQMPSAA